MSSVHRQPSRKHWYCAFTDASGKRHFKSTGTTDKREAKRLCDAIQRAADQARSGNLTEDRARTFIEKNVQEIVASIGGSLKIETIETFVQGWLKSKESTVSESTFKSWKAISASFLAYLGKRAGGSMANVTVGDLEQYRDKIAERVSSGTTNNHLKWLRLLFQDAHKKNQIDRNPARLVDNLARADKHQRHGFSVEQVRKILAVCPTDWRTMVLVATYTGQRLNDCANLTWRNLDLQRGVFMLTTQKTGREIINPIAKPLLRHLESLPAGDDPDAPLCPTLHGSAQPRLSSAFYTIMTRAGIVEKRVYRGREKREDGRKEQSPYGFHSLRRTATDLLKNAGVSNAIAMDIIGHESEAVSKSYTKIDDATKRQALDAMPDITQ